MTPLNVIIKRKTSLSCNIASHSLSLVCGKVSLTLFSQNFLGRYLSRRLSLNPYIFLLIFFLNLEASVWPSLKSMKVNRPFLSFFLFFSFHCKFLFILAKQSTLFYKLSLEQFSIEY